MGVEWNKVLVGLILGLNATSLARAAEVRYSYDQLNRLTRVLYPDGTTITYTYDRAGNRLSQIITSPNVPAPVLTSDKASLTFSAAAGQSTTASQLIVIRNDGGGSLQWTAAATATWIALTPTSGANAGVINVSASATGLAPGAYNAGVVIYATSNAPVTIPVTLTVTAGPARPTISEGGIVSAAGFHGALARGAVSSLFGGGFANGVVVANSVPLPRTLGDVRIAVNGLDVPLWFVSPEQINFQVPFETPLNSQVPVIVYRDNVASPPVLITVLEYAPGIFTYERLPGVFDPIIVRPNGGLVSPENPAQPGDILVVYGTGVGNLATTPSTGGLTQESPLARSQTTPVITLGGLQVEVLFSGLTPGAIGLAQFNIRLPDTLPEGSNQALVVRFGAVSSQPVNLAIQPR